MVYCAWPQHKYVCSGPVTLKQLLAKRFHGTAGRHTDAFVQCHAVCPVDRPMLVPTSVERGSLDESWGSLLNSSIHRTCEGCFCLWCCLIIMFILHRSQTIINDIIMTMTKDVHMHLCKRSLGLLRSDAHATALQAAQVR